MQVEKATLGGGCFWCLEPIFAELRGVVHVEPGYAGGHVPEPSYEAVCSGSTGHAEVVHVAFDSDVLSFRDLLEVFFAVHDPTTKDRQGADVGSQYRSVIFTHSDAQRQTAIEAIRSLTRDPKWEGAAVVTEVEPFTAFYPAEGYHHAYFANYPERGYCRVVIAPKVEKFRRRFNDRLEPNA